LVGIQVFCYVGPEDPVFGIPEVIQTGEIQVVSCPLANTFDSIYDCAFQFFDGAFSRTSHGIVMIDCDENPSQTILSRCEFTHANAAGSVANDRWIRTADAASVHIRDCQFDSTFLTCIEHNSTGLARIVNCSFDYNAIYGSGFHPEYPTTAVLSGTGDAKLENVNVPSSLITSTGTVTQLPTALSDEVTDDNVTIASGHTEIVDVKVTKQFGGATCRMEGEIDNNGFFTANGLTNVCTVPVGFRPSRNVRGTCTFSDGSQSSFKAGAAYIHTDGRVFVEIWATNQKRVYLDGIRYQLNF
jgi:hypothetical protein